MKKILILMICGCLMFSSCTVGKNFSQAFTYKDPQTIGGLWTVIDGSGNKYEHCKCTYWGTNDDTAIFTHNGKIVCISGNVTVIEE